MGNAICNEVMTAYGAYLESEEKSEATREKYLMAVHRFVAHMGGINVTKDTVLSFKKALIERGYGDRTVNGYLSGVGSFLKFIGMSHCMVKKLKIQKTVYIPEERMLTKAEYERLINASRDDEQLLMIMETFACTGIRVSELKYFTVENVRAGCVDIRNKGKARTILISGKLKKRLMDFAKKSKIKSGVIFANRYGKPLDRSVIWARMKKLCKNAGVAATKVFPHNLRRLFARGFYKVAKDIVKLADVLGHSSIDTTRIYLLETGREHMEIIERMGLVV